MVLEMGSDYIMSPSVSTPMISMRFVSSSRMPGDNRGQVVSWSYGRWFEIRDPDDNAVRFFAPNQP